MLTGIFASRPMRKVSSSAVSIVSPSLRMWLKQTPPYFAATLARLMISSVVEYIAGR